MSGTSPLPSFLPPLGSFHLFFILPSTPSFFFFFSFRPPSRNASVNRRRRRTNIYLALITILFFLSWDGQRKKELIGFSTISHYQTVH